MQRRKFSRHFKFDAVKLVKDSSVAVAQAARDLDIHGNVLRKWIRDAGNDPQHALPYRGRLVGKAERELASVRAAAFSQFETCIRRAMLGRVRAP